MGADWPQDAPRGGAHVPGGTMTTTQLDLSRRNFLRIAGVAGAGLFLVGEVGGRPFRVPLAAAAVPGGTLAPADIPKFVTPLLVPPAMPRAGTIKMKGGKPADYYEISMKQFAQQMLPAGMPSTVVWGYGAVAAARAKNAFLLHNAPSATIEAEYNRPVRVKWINELVDGDGHALPHLLPVDPTLHWANPPGGTDGRDSRPGFDSVPSAYTGPVPIVTHVHGAIGVGEESDGYTEAWYLPDASDIPAGYAVEGSLYGQFRGEAEAKFGDSAYDWGPGYAVFEYPNLGRASTDWYHDHALGMTRVNVYAGPAGFFIIRGGPHGDKAVLDGRDNTVAILPGPAPTEGDKFPPNKTYRDIALAIQDRSFNSDGSLFYPDTREIFDGIVGDFIGQEGGEFPPIWNPEFFGNTLIVNGNTWPHLEVEQRRYRFRVLNGCQSRFLILDFKAIPGVKAWIIGNEGGFLPAPVDLAGHNDRLLMGLAERADLIVDFTNVPVGNHVLANVGPDEPFGGGVPGVDFEVADPASTGTIMQFRVVPALALDDTTPPQHLVLPALAPLGAATVTRKLALIEGMGEGTVAGQEEPEEGPIEALLGTVNDSGFYGSIRWMEPVTENPAVGATEMWEFYNTTGDAHPIHIHEIAFEVISRQRIFVDEEAAHVQVDDLDVPRPAEAWETGVKDTVIAYPGEVTRVKALFANPGLFVWHCHILEHEDNEMMRPFRIGP